MPDWTEKQVQYLQTQWRRSTFSPDDLTLAAATCPNCVHHPAFSHIVLGEAFVRGVKKDETTSGGYPDRTVVDCNCAQHDGKGCGYAGGVPVIPPEIPPK